MKHVGIACSLSVAVCYAIVAVATRKLQKVHYSIVLWYYAVFSVIALGAFLLGEAYYNGENLRLLTMTRLQVGFLSLSSIFNAFALMSNTIALQNEKSGFITSVGYMALVYAFCGDLIIFDASFSV
jgi:drug/metabolite transporter (DMT)-like permease